MDSMNEFARDFKQRNPELFAQAHKYAAIFAGVFSVALDAFDAVAFEDACEQQQLDFEEALDAQIAQDAAAQLVEDTAADRVNAHYEGSRLLVLRTCKEYPDIWNRYCARAVDAADFGTTARQFARDVEPLVRIFMGIRISNTERSIRTSYLNRAVVALFPETARLFRMQKPAPGKISRLDDSPWTQSELEELRKLLD